MNRKSHENTSTPFEVYCVSLLTARDATIQQHTAVGTLATMERTAFKLSSIRTVAQRFERKL